MCTIWGGRYNIRTASWPFESVDWEMALTAHRAIDRRKQPNRPSPHRPPEVTLTLSEARSAGEFRPHRGATNDETDAPTSTVRIERAGVGDIDVVANLLGEAFHDLAPARWLVVNPRQRVLVLPSYLRIHVEHAMRFGEVHVTADRSATAIWFPYNRSRPEPANYHTRLALASGQFADRFRNLEAVLTAHHPPWPHHYLALLAVRPGRQGRGYGGALLRHQHTHLDTHDIPAYVYTHNRRSRDLYQQHGYHVRGEPIILPSGASVWCMLRKPIPPATAPGHAPESRERAAAASVG